MCVSSCGLKKVCMSRIKNQNLHHFIHFAFFLEVDETLKCKAGREYEGCRPRGYKPRSSFCLGPQTSAKEKRAPRYRLAYLLRMSSSSSCVFFSNSRGSILSSPVAISQLCSASVYPSGVLRTYVRDSSIIPKNDKLLFRYTWLDSTRRDMRVMKQKRWCRNTRRYAYLHGRHQRRHCSRRFGGV